MAGHGKRLLLDVVVLVVVVVVRCSVLSLSLSFLYSIGRATQNLELAFVIQTFVKINLTVISSKEEFRTGLSD